MRTSFFTIFSLVYLSVLGCQHGTSNDSNGIPEELKAFWGDSTAVIVAKNPQNGYRISIINNKDLTLAHFERGDSISVYCSLDWLPLCARDYENKTGVFDVDIDIPVVRVDTLGGRKTPKSDVFFMDVNFDGQEEFVQGYEANGWVGYNCYDIVNGGSGNSSVSRSIQSITESTGDLLAAYVNAIRADSSANRQTLTQILAITQSFSEMPIVAKAQLAQLETIARNTYETAQNTIRINDIYELFHRVILGSESVRIR